MCELGQVLKKHMSLLMDIFQEELAEYNMGPDSESRNTKCLNNAVTLLFSYLGSNALRHTKFCDVPNVQRRSKIDGDDSLYNLAPCT